MLCLPPMLILDEATSSIDTRTELMVQEAFDRLMEGRTSSVSYTHLAEQILSDLAFSSAEKEQILTAIGEHRSSKEETSSLSRILYEADKKSRMCFLCPAEKECYWDLSKKNMMIQY